MHNAGKTLRKNALTVATAMLVAGVLAHSSFALAQVQGAHNSAVKTARANSAESLAPSRGVKQHAAPAFSGALTLPRNSNDHHAQPLSLASWLGLVAAGIVLVTLGGTGVRHAWPAGKSNVLNKQRKAARTQQRHLHAKLAADEFLGGESWVSGTAHVLGNAALAATQPLRALQRTQPIRALDADNNVDTAHVPAIPHTFDTATCEREAKALFIRLMAAWGAQDQSELFRLLMPHALAALAPQNPSLAPQGPLPAAQNPPLEAVPLPAQPAAVDFLTLNAQVLRASKSTVTSAFTDLADVRFHGLYRGTEQSTASAFDCVWSLTHDRGIWRLSAIQAL